MRLQLLLRDAAAGREEVRREARQLHDPGAAAGVQRQCPCCAGRDISENTDERPGFHVSSPMSARMRASQQ